MDDGVTGNDDTTGICSLCAIANEIEVLLLSDHIPEGYVPESQEKSASRDSICT
jgi:hypothetical protein